MFGGISSRNLEAVIQPQILEQTVNSIKMYESYNLLFFSKTRLDIKLPKVSLTDNDLIAMKI